MARRKTQSMKAMDMTAKFNEAVGSAPEGKVALFMHRNPDPDAMGAAVGLQWLMQKGYGREVVIFYNGEVSHWQNKTMLNVLEIRMVPESEYVADDYAMTVVVDATTSNASPSEADIVIDHHRSNEKHAKCAMVEAVGSASTLVWELIRDADITFEDDTDERIATSMFIGIRVDTNELISETATDRDYTASQQLAQHLDRKKLAAVINYPLPPYLFELRKLLDQDGNSAIEKSYFVGTVGIISKAKRDALPMIADERVRVEGTETAIVFAVVDNGIDVSVRSQNASIDIDAFCKKIFGSDFAGGKSGAGGAFVPLGILGYDNLPGEKVNELWEAQKKALFHKILHVAQGN